MPDDVETEALCPRATHQDTTHNTQTLAVDGVFALAAGQQGRISEEMLISRAVLVLVVIGVSTAKDYL